MSTFNVEIRLLNLDTQETASMAIEASNDYLFEDEDWGMYLMDDIRRLAGETE